MTARPRPDRTLAAKLICIGEPLAAALEQAGFALGKRPRQAIRRALQSAALAEALRDETALRVRLAAAEVAAGLATRTRLTAARALQEEIERLISSHGGASLPSDPDRSWGKHTDPSNPRLEW